MKYTSCNYGKTEYCNKNEDGNYEITPGYQSIFT